MSEESVILLRRPAPDIAVLAFNDPRHGANVLSRTVLNELAAQLDQLAGESLRGLIITSDKPNSLLAGADLKELHARLDAPRDELRDYLYSGRRLFARLHSLPYPTVVAWSGTALGGGAELALWADFRIAADTPGTQLGLPEVKLGLIPGWGGIFTAARWAGIGNVLEMICGGESLAARQAERLGLIDEVVAPERLMDAALARITLAGTGDLWAKQRARLDQPPRIAAADLEFLGSIAKQKILQQSGGHYPAPLAALEVLLTTATADADTACDRAADEMVKLVGTPVNRALLSLYFARERNKKDSGLDYPSTLRPTTIERVGVIGAGIMGYSISAVNLKHGKQIKLTDANAEALAAGAQKALDEAAWSRTVRGPDPVRRAELAARLSTADGISTTGNCELVIEAVVENVRIKRELLQRCEAELEPTAFLASNTSTIRIAELATGLQRPERFCGMHFFNPVRRMPLVEIIRGPQTGDEAVLAAVAYAKQIGKTPIVVRDGPGFLVNRLLSPYLNEALALLHEGYHWSTIDAAAVEFGMPIGPFAIYDMVGTDTALFAGRVMWEAFPERTLLSPVLVELYKAGRMGQKSGAGFFRYERGKDQPLPDPAADELLAKHQAPLAGPPLDSQSLQYRLLIPMLYEAALVLEEGLVRRREDIDLGVVLGLGFPAFRGGILRWADQVGLTAILEQAARHPTLTARRPTPTMLLNMAAAKERFHSK